jgi:hypothetical protein
MLMFISCKKTADVLLSACKLPVVCFLCPAATDGEKSEKLLILKLV